jgi:diguanylate cyclase (GGDEF)-like protein
LLLPIVEQAFMRVSRSVILAQALALSAVAVGIGVSASSGDWDVPLMGLLLGLAALSDIAAVDFTDAKIGLSGAFVALVLAMVLLGGAPAAVLGVVTVVMSWLRRREPIHALRHNILVFAAYPLIGGVVFHAALAGLDLDDTKAAYYLLVLATFLFALVVNFVLVAVYMAAIGRASLRQSLVEAFLPVLSSEILTGLITVAAVFLYSYAGLPAIVLVGVALVGFQHLLKELLLSRQRALALEERTRQLHAQALTDELTGLGNRRRLFEDLEDRMAEATLQRPLLLAVFDLDGFKQYNDQFGHPEGDLLLRRLGGRLREAIGEAGDAYRPGGDEFCFLAAAGWERARDLVAAGQAALTDEGRGFHVHASTGHVVLPEEAVDAAEALRLADQRMYASKEARPASAKRQARDLLLRVLAEQQPDLHDHLSDVWRLAVGIGRELGMSDAEVDDVARAAELHDVGKIAIPVAILTKPGPLNDEEWRYMRRHTLIGERMLRAAPALRGVARLVRSSHERWDGGGYPDGLVREEIPLGSRIIAVCDAYDAMLARRPYNRQRGEAAAVQELIDCAGAHFDPDVVRAFLRCRADANDADPAIARAAPDPFDFRSRAGDGP